MKTLLKSLLALSFAGFALAQTFPSNIPPCNANANITTGCTDYFGVANSANSPLPAGSIVSLTIMTGGSGYSSPTVVITDPSGTGATATAVADPNGVITSMNVTNGGSGYIAPVVTIMDPTGTGATASALIGGTLIGGMRKFVDPLPSLAVAVPDTVTFPGSDYYEIALVQYEQQMHSDLPKTRLRGYVQVNNGTDASGQNTKVPAPVSYLGPLIIAQRNRPVRILFHNLLPTGAGGNLFIPVDTTYMGAGNDANGQPYTQNRGELHLHGGVTPWISDGTPHQWTVPVGESANTMKGASVQYVPDMWFDPNTHAVVPAGTAGATNDPGPGSLTYYWTNEQGGRLMFYHDHAYGITRLNVYVGEAAGYLLADPVEEDALANATVPGTINTTAPDYAHLIPLVIQDRTFVPSAAQLNAEDPTWVTLGAGTTPGSAHFGDLWFPHVYMPNQNPRDPVGVNAFGRWDYGPWFWPPQTSLSAANPPTAITVPCTSSAYPGVTLGCPITPNPSGTPEGFMDTPVVNGKAYPVLHVGPSAYRFQILNAANDRSWNLQLYVADSSGTEVTMIPAATPSATTMAACPNPVPITNPTLGIGIASAVLDGTGNPINGTGLPANCWPSSWSTDGRDGGVPDPRTAGPPIIQIGSEGGLLPTPVVIPSTPVNFEYNRRSVTVLNVSTHGLWMGPAERADVIIDFSAFAGRTLIVYNDAPAPAPAFDERFDYYTGDPGQTEVGGAPSTQPGYGPNTRTIMQIVVDGNAPNTQKFSVAALKAAFASTATAQGLFPQTQPQIVVPQSAYNTALNAKLPNVFSAIQDTSLTFTPVGGTTATTMAFQPKAIQELFTTDYGRMNATLGTELPLTSFLTQTTIPLGYIDPVTEIIQGGQPQLWKITHNGVDTHFIHFHLFNVQVINRMGWDGSIRPPDENELGWKETVRMNPLEDILVAIQPIIPTLPWPLPDSIRPMDVTAPSGTTAQFTGVNPFTNNPAATLNAPQNFGWEYVWHCHLLGHEENDMMRPMMVQVPPPAPTNLTASTDSSVVGQVDLVWQDNSASESGFVVQRATDPNFTQITASFNVAPSNPNTAFGGAITATDKPGANVSLYYRVQAVDNNFSGNLEQAYNSTPALYSGWSNIAMIGPPASASIAPLTVAFGNQLVNTVSGGRIVTVTNTGTVALAILSASISGANTADFAFNNACPGSLGSGLTCTMTVTFKPAATGARTAILNVTTSAPTATAVQLTGTGVAPTASVTPVALTFANQLVGSTSVAQTVTITNSGTSPLIVNGISVATGNASEFAIMANACATGGAGLPGNSSCTVNVNFTPAAMGTRSSVLVVSTSDPVKPVVNVSLTGVGIEAIASLAPPSMTFPLQLLNTSSNTQTATLSNTGNVAMTINGISLTGTNPSDYVINYTCPIGSTTPLGAGASCTITVTFRPTTSGTRTAAVSVSTTALVNPNPTVALSGIGTAVNLSSTALTFGAQVLNTTSGPQVVTLANGGTTALAIAAVTLGGPNATDYTLATTCGANLAAGRSCTLTVRFRPATAGVRTAAITVKTSDLGMPSATISISGTGIASVLSLSPASIDFGTTTLGQTAGPTSITVTNTGTAALVINSITLGGTNPNQFAIASNSCPMRAPSLAVGATCTIGVTFVPTNATTTSKSATLTVNPAAPATAQSVSLTGTINVPVFTLTPTTITFGTQARRTTSAAQKITVANTGTAPLTINSISFAGGNANQFGMTSTCTSTLQANSSCSVSVVFAPTTAGAKATSLDIRVAAPATSQSVPISGTGL